MNGRKDESQVFLTYHKATGECEVHHKPVEFFCEDHNEVCCSRCAVTLHRQCQNVVEVEKMTERNATEIPKLVAELEKRAKKLVQRSRCVKIKFTKSASEIKDKIQTMQDQVNSVFEKLKQSVTEEISSIENEAFKDFDEKEASCQVFVSEVKQMLMYDLKENPTGNIVKIQGIKDSIAKHMTVIELEDKELKEVVLSFDFDENIFSLFTNKATPGELTVKYILPTDTLAKTRDNPPVTLNLVASTDLKEGDGNLAEPLYSGLDFLPDGRLVAVDNTNHKFVLFSEDLQMLGSYKLPDKPMKVLAISEDEVVITTWNLVFLRVSKTNEITFIRTCVVTRIYESISMMDDNTFLVGTVDDPYPVRILTIDGEEKEIDVHLPITIYPTDHSACTYIRSYHKVVFIDRYANIVYLCDIGSKTREEVTDNKLIGRPCSMAVGPGDTVFICCNRTNSIVQMSHPETTNVLLSRTVAREK